MNTRVEETALEGEANYVTCRCSSCSGGIEFDRNCIDSGASIAVACPHCGAETKLYVPAEGQTEVSKPTGKPARFPRVTLTKAQCASPEGAELMSLLVRIGDDGTVTEEEVRQLRSWVKEKGNCGIPAISFLDDITKRVLRDGKVTADEAVEVQFAIERVLPKDVRADMIERRTAAWRGSPASDRQIEYLTSLGADVSSNLSKGEASELLDRLTNQATDRQLAYIRDLGGHPAPGLTKSEASSLIEELLASKQPSLRQLMVLRFWDRMDLATMQKNRLTDWLTHFYGENPRRKLAWELFKAEFGDDGSQQDPSWVPLGAGMVYLRKAEKIPVARPANTQKSGCFSVVALVLILAIVVFWLLRSLA